MPYQFANTLDQLMLTLKVEQRNKVINPMQLCDKGCDLLDTIEEQAKHLFLKHGAVNKQQENALVSRGYAIEQGVEKGVFRIHLKTPKGILILC